MERASVSLPLTAS